jgi:hypothetical protein
MPMLFRRRRSLEERILMMMMKRMVPLIGSNKMYGVH